jgi:hypothetical protein
VEGKDPISYSMPLWRISELQRTIMTEKTRKEDPDIVRYNDNLRLRSISIRKGDDRSIFDHGKLVDR